MFLQVNQRMQELEVDPDTNFDTPEIRTVVGCFASDEMKDRMELALLAEKRYPSYEVLMKKTSPMFDSMLLNRLIKVCELVHGGDIRYVNDLVGVYERVDRRLTGFTPFTNAADLSYVIMTYYMRLRMNTTFREMLTVADQYAHWLAGRKRCSSNNTTLITWLADKKVYWDTLLKEMKAETEMKKTR